MEIKDVKVDLSELKEFKRKNAEERLKFIDFWVEYMKSHSDKEWSKGQADFIDSQYQTARRFWKNFKKVKSDDVNKIVYEDEVKID